MFNQFPSLFTGTENREEHILKIGYSAFYFAVTFVFLHYTGHAWSAANAWDVGYHPLFNYDRMDSLAAAVNWTANKVGWVYLAPPVWGLVISVASIIAFRFTEGTQTHFKTLFYWMAINGYLLYFSYLITGILSGQDYSSTMFTGFASYYGWLEWSSAKIYGILTIQMIISLPYAIFFSKGVLQLNFSRLLAAKPNGKPIIFMYVVVLPYIFGSILIVLTTFPLDAGYQVVRILCYIPVLIVAFLGMGFYRAKHISIVKGGLRPVSLIALVVLVVLLLGSRFGLGVSVEPFW